MSRSEFLVINVGLRVRIRLPPPASQERTVAGGRSNIVGVHELIFDFRGQAVAESIERLQRFATQIMPLAKG